MPTTRNLAEEVAERKRAEAALRASEELFSKAFQLSPDCLMIARLSDRIVLRANEALGRLWGRRPEEIIGRQGRDFAVWLDETERLAFMKTVQEQGECLDHETRLRLTDGRVLDFNLSSRLITVGGETCILSNLRDISVRKSAEAAVAQLAAIVQSSDDAIVGKNLDGIVTSWNGAAERIFGYRAAEMIGQPVARLFPADRRHEEDEILSQIRNGENVRHYETVRLRKDGQAIDVSVTVSPTRNAAGAVAGASKVARDITGRKAAETAMRASDDRMRLATEATGVGIWEWNVNTNMIRWDAQMFRIYGLAPTPDRFVPYHTWAGCVLPEDLGEQEAVLQDTVRRLGHSSREFRIQRPDNGEIRRLRAVETVRTNGQGQAEWMVGTNLDITERQKMEMALRDSEERFRTLANSIPQLAWIARADGYIYWYNLRWYEYTGTSQEQMEGWGWQGVHDPGVLPEVMVNWQDAIATRKAFEMEFPLRGADGTFRAFLTRVQPLKDSAGRVIQWFGTNTDVEGLKQAEEKVQQLNAELEQRVIERTEQLEQANRQFEAANKELEAFSYSVSHDLRAPLRAVNGFAEMVLEEFGPQLSAEGRRYLERIRNGGQQMGLLIDDLLAFSRLSRQAMNREPVDTRGLVQSVLDETGSQPADRRITWQVGQLPFCEGDPALLKQVWVNLISNAIKYTRGREPAIIEIGCERRNGGNVFFVRDNGAGFDMQYAQKLFGVFQRMHRADEFEGTGVGLAIVQRIVHRHDGRVWAEAALDRGATFSFTLAAPKPPTSNGQL